MVSTSRLVERVAANKRANKCRREGARGRGAALSLAFVLFLIETVSSSNTRIQDICQVTNTHKMVKDGDAEFAATTDHTSVDLLADESWLGTEKNLLPVLEERKGVYDILEGLSNVDRLAMEATDNTMPIRHLRAEKGNAQKAISKIESTLRWRKEFGVNVIKNCFLVEGTDEDTEEHKQMRSILEEESSTAKMYVRGFDREGRALQYMCQMRENTWNQLNNMRYLVYTMEKSIACTKAKSGKEKFNLLIDFDNFQMKKSASMSTSKYTLDIMQNHYPERMNRAFIMKPPTAFRMFWSLIKPFVDPVTKTKIVFCSREGSELLQIADASNLEPRAYGTGTDLRDFDPNEYLRLPFEVSF